MYMWNEKGLVVIIDASKKNSALSIYKIEASLDTANGLVLLKAYQAAGKEFKTEFQVNLPFIPRHLENYHAVWVNPDGEHYEMIRIRNLDYKDCKPYFEFDRIEYYNLEMTDSAINEMSSENQKSTKPEREFYSFLTDLEQDSLSDTLSLSNLEGRGFNKKELKPEKFDSINKVFCEISAIYEGSIRMCIPYYRDILIFKKSNTIIGYAKICFACEMRMIVGSDRSDSSLAFDKDFVALAKVLDLQIKEKLKP